MIGFAGNGRFHATSRSITWSSRCGGEPPRSAVGMRDPGDAAKADPLIFEFSRFLFAGLAVDAVRIDLAIVDAPGFFGKALADVMAVGLALRPHLRQRRRK